MKAKTKAAMFLIALAFPLYAQRLAHYRYHGSVVLPDPQVTPGAVRTTNKAELCAESFRTGPYRKTTASEKRRVCEKYGAAHCPGPDWELDHLISLEIGGEDSEDDLWPQPAAGIGYHVKDKLENALHKMVCEGKITVPEAQKCIATDWFACGLKLGVFDKTGQYLLGKPKGGDAK